MTTFAAQLERLQQMRRDLVSQLRSQRGGADNRVEAALQNREQVSDDWAAAETEMELGFALEAHELEEIAAIDAAMARIKQGTYGECQDCGVDIGQARLNANPVAMRCIQCQSKAEKA